VLVVLLNITGVGSRGDSIFVQGDHFTKEAFNVVKEFDNHCPAIFPGSI
jgi:hypothetical protein